MKLRSWPRRHCFAEHMAKAIICGADLITINLPLLVALECHLCDSCQPGTPCRPSWRKLISTLAWARMTI